MDDNERQQLETLADSLFAVVPELWQTLLKELGRMGQARKQVSAVINAGEKEAHESPLGRALYEGSQNAQIALFFSTLDFVENPLKRLQSGTAAKTTAGKSDETPTPDLAEAIQQLRASHLGLQTAKIFLGFTLILLHAAVASYIDACEAFLGREIGSHQVRKRVWPVVKEAFGSAVTEVAPSLAFPFLAIPLAFRNVLTEAYRQIKTSPQDGDEAAQRITGASNAALGKLQETAVSREQEMPDLQGYVSTSVDAVLEEISVIYEVEHQLQPLFGSVPASGPGDGSPAGPWPPP